MLLLTKFSEISGGDSTATYYFQFSFHCIKFSVKCCWSLEVNCKKSLALNAIAYLRFCQEPEKNLSPFKMFDIIWCNKWGSTFISFFCFSFLLSLSVL